MIDYSYSLIRHMIENKDSFVLPVSLVLASLNMLVQILFSAIFGADSAPKLRGERS